MNVYIVEYIVKGLSDYLLNFEHLGPHRQPPKRFIRDDGSAGNPEYMEILKMINDDRQIKLMNSALKTLDIPYRLPTSRKNWDKFTKHREITLIDSKNTEISILDVGYGVSQVLPIIIKAFTKFGKIIVIEQPELHLHPKLQANLADIFALSSLFNGNKFVLETHSESLMLRYQRRLRELDNSQRKDNNFSLALTELDDFLENIDHIKLYAKFQARDSKINVIAISIDNKSRVSSKKTIALAKDGEFEVEWPDGFFDDRFKELDI